MNTRTLLLSTLLISFLVAPGCGPGGGDLTEGIYTGPTAPASLGNLFAYSLNMSALDDSLWNAYWAAEGPVNYLDQVGGLLDFGGEYSLVGDGMASLIARAVADSAPLVTTDEYPISTAYPHPYGDDLGWIEVEGVARFLADDGEGSGFIEEEMSTDVTVTFHDFYVAEGESLSGAIRLVSTSGHRGYETGESREWNRFRVQATNFRVRLDAEVLARAKDIGPEIPDMWWYPFGNSWTYHGGFEYSSQGHRFLQGEEWVNSEETNMTADATIVGDQGGQVRLVGTWGDFWLYTLDEADRRHWNFVRGTVYSTQLGGSVTFHNENTGLVEEDDYRFTITGDGWTIRTWVYEDGGFEGWNLWWPTFWPDYAEIDEDGDGEPDGEFYGLSNGVTLLPFFDSAIGFSFGS